MKRERVAPPPVKISAPGETGQDRKLKKTGGTLQDFSVMGRILFYYNFTLFFFIAINFYLK